MNGLNRRLSARQILWVALVIGLLVPLSMLSRPASIDRQAGSGGRLAQLRAQYKLGEANVGQIDPRSETVRLLSLGLGSIANVMLWSQAEDYKIKEDWNGYRTVLDQLAHLQPHYPVVWEHQAWNLAYNISAEFEDYHDKYYWVIDGIRFIQRGTAYNENNPRLLFRTGTFTSHKIGRSDERLYYRRLFAQDDDFHRDQHVQQRDSWLFSRDYFLEAQHAVDDLGAPLTFLGPYLFHSEEVRAQMFAGEALESDHQQAIEAELKRSPGPSAERDARLASIDANYAGQTIGRWTLASQRWNVFEGREFLTEAGDVIRIGDGPSIALQVADIERQFTELDPDLRHRAESERRGQLTLEGQVLLQTPDDQLTPEDREKVKALRQKLQVNWDDLARLAPETKREQARELATRGRHLAVLNDEIEKVRDILNHAYWVKRCVMETSDEVRAGRRALVQAAALYRVEADLLNARRLFEEGFQQWRAVLDQYPEMISDQTSFLITEAIEAYRVVLQQLDEPFPTPFVLQDLLDKADS